MEIWESISRSKREEAIIKSLVWNSVVFVFKEEKEIDIKEYLISVRLVWNNVFVKTNNPLVNTELFLIDDKIKKLFSEKLKKVWIKFYDFSIKYI